MKKKTLKVIARNSVRTGSTYKQELYMKFTWKSKWGILTRFINKANAITENQG